MTLGCSGCVDENTIYCECGKYDAMHTKLRLIKSTPFRNLPNLKNLYLRDAQLTVLSAFQREFPGMCNQLQTIDLSHNDLSQLDLWNDFYRTSLFSRKPFLAEINLDSNQNVKDIPKYTFQNLSRLSNLSMRNCGLTKIDPILFHDLVGLEYLYLDGNVISDLHGDTFSNLKNLDFYHLKKITIPFLSNFSC